MSVAYLTSYTLTDDDSNSSESLLHELEGAYAAQRRNNDGDLSGNPKIRLLLANSGSNSDQWEYTVAELVKLKNTDAKLVAVTGLGPSTKNNLKAARRLSREDLALVASIMTTTDIHGIDNFVRVSPTNQEEATAAATYLKQKTQFKTAVVVQDVDKDNSYAETLGEEFERAFRDDSDNRLKLKKPTLTFDVSERTAWENELDENTAELCRRRPDVIFFAGRGMHLTRFLHSLANRQCKKDKFTVITGDDTTNLTAGKLSEAAETGVKVFYTGLAHPDMFKENQDAVADPSYRFFTERTRLDKWFPGEVYDDGQAMMAHDAILTAAKGIHMAARNNTEVTGGGVNRMFHHMEHKAVPGASGYLYFGEDGNPPEKVIPIVRLVGAGTEFEYAVQVKDDPPKKR